MKDNQSLGTDDGKKQSQNTRRRFVERAGAVLSFLAALAAMLGGSFIGRNTELFFHPSYATRQDLGKLVASSDRNGQELGNLQRSVDELTAEILKVSKSQPAAVQIAILGTKVDVLQTQVKQLNDAIGQSPEKALAMPLLKKDVEDFRDSYRHDLDNTQTDINRVYDLSKWIIGTIGLGLLSLAVTVFLQTRSR